MRVQALADVVSDVLGTSRWLNDPVSGEKALPPLKEYPVPKAFCEVRCFVFREHLHSYRWVQQSSRGLQPPRCRGAQPA